MTATYLSLLWGLWTLLLVIMVWSPHPVAALLLLLFGGRLLALKRPRFLRLLLAWSVGLLLLTGLQRYHHQSRLTGQENSFIVTVSPQKKQINGDYLQLTARIATGPACGEKLRLHYTLKTPEEQAAWSQQQTMVRLKVQGQLEKPKSQRNPGSFNYRAYLWQEKIFWQFTVSAYKVLGPVRGPRASWTACLAAIKGWAKGIPSPPVRAYFLAVLFNDRKEMEADTLSAYQKLGLIHLFSLSGFHVTYLMTLIKKLCYRAGLLVEYTDILLVILLLSYTVILGAPYGMVRAVISTLAQMAGRYLKRPVSPLMGNTLALVFILMLAPVSIYSLGFQLSFALSYTVMIGPGLVRGLWGGRLGQELGQGFWCTLVSIPFLLAQQFEVPWLGLFVNYFFSLFFTLVLLPTLLLVFLLHIFGLLAYFSPFLELLGLLLEKVGQVSQTLAQQPGLLWRTGQVPGILMLAFSGILLFYMNAKLQDRHLKRWRGALLLALIILNFTPYYRPTGRLMMIDMGQGDCLYLELPHHQGQYLIDVGGRFNFPKEGWRQGEGNYSIARQEILPALRAAGVRSLDGIFITHSDYDHYGSLAEVAQELPVKNLYLPIGVQGDKKFLHYLSDVFTGKQTTVQWLAKGQVVSLNPRYQLTVLHPDKVAQGENESSLVLYGQLGQAHVLLTGDLEGWGEEAVLKIFKERELPVDILKIAHHGSPNSTGTEVLDTLAPAYAWLSVGKNTYGHPSPELLDNLRKRKIPYYRTDEEGAITYEFSQTNSRFRKHRSEVE